MHGLITINQHAARASQRAARPASRPRALARAWRQALSRAVRASALACLAAVGAAGAMADAMAGEGARPTTLVAPAPDARATRARGAAGRPPVVAVQGRVLRVLDGDSLLVIIADNGVRGVRIAGIDAPEKGQSHADASRRALLALLDQREVRVDAVKTDAFDRLVGRVFVDGRDAGLAQLRAGLAWHFRRYDADLAPAVRRRYAEAERQARLRRVGLWRDPAPTPPWEHRASARASVRR